MINKKLVIFESLGYCSIPIIYWYRSRNYLIKYFTMDSKIQNTHWLKNLLIRHSVNEIIIDDFYTTYMSHDLALDNIERVYNKLLSKSKLIGQMVSLLNSDMVHLVYKKDLVVQLQKFYHVCTHLNSVIDNTDNNIIFVPSDFFRFEKLTEMKLNSNIHIPFWSRIFTYINELLKKSIYIIALAILPFLVLLWKTRKITLKETVPKKYQNGIRIYRTDFGFHHKYRTIDFLIDGKKLNKDNTLFCVDTDISKEYMQKLMEKKYNIVEIPKILSEINLRFIKDVLIKKIIPCSLKSVYFSTSEMIPVIKTTIGSMYKYMVWTQFTKKYNIKNFVVYNHFEKYHIVRNIILSQNSVKTWYYLHSTHFGHVFKKPQCEISMRHSAFSYLYYDYLVSWGNDSSSIFDNLYSSIKKHQKLGCFWSEHTRMIIDGDIPSYLSQITLFNNAKRKPLKIIGVFDTTFGKDAPLQTNDMNLFVKGLLKLLQNNSDVGIIIKEKNAKDQMLAASPDVPHEYDKLYNLLQSHERCYSTGWTGDASDIIASSDLVISACFTSTTPEALGARKKAIFFDASNRFKGSYYDKFPKMVAHGFDELDKFVKYWLCEVSDAKFNEYIDYYIIDELDSYADGRAITRFRELLSEVNI